MHTNRIDRRKALTVVAAAPAAFTLTGAALAKIEPTDNELPDVIRRYQAELADIHARHESLSWKDY
jgi:hypothetical protein